MIVRRQTRMDVVRADYVLTATTERSPVNSFYLCPQACSVLFLLQTCSAQTPFLVFFFLFFSFVCLFVLLVL